jgi:hypothetical protein
MMKICVLACALPLVVAANASADLVDGGFEWFDVPGYGFYQGGLDTPWRTTAPDNLIEGWSDGFLGVPAYEGSHFAELNANYASTLYQDVNGLGDFQQINWRFAHRGRDGVDGMRFTITDLGTDQQFGGGDDTVLYTGDFYDGNTAWGVYGGTITSVGNLTRFAFEALSAVGGSTQGNLLDDCGFGVNVVIPAPGAASLLLLAGLAAGRRRGR